MVKEKRILFEVGDIVSIRIQCRKCDGSIVQPANKGSLRPDSCPLCGVVWTPPSSDIAADRLIQAFRDVLDQDTPIRVRLELNDDSVEAG